jgi:hypothetical protein
MLILSVLYCAPLFKQYLASGTYYGTRYVLETTHRRFLPMAMIKCPESECGNMVSDQAAACPKCGRPLRKVEYKFLTVSHSIRYGGYDGKDEYEALLKMGWQVVDERLEEVVNDDGELYAVRWHYKLQK